MKKAKTPSRSEPKPSVATKDYWLYAERKKGTYPASGSKSGKWLVFVRTEEVDEVWAKIKRAVENGDLGDEAKVATAKPTPYSPDDSRRVICVYTYDYEDIDDVRRIRAELRRLGVTDRIPYKSDEDTEAGKYSVRGRGRISKLFE